jgi:drug/metabolite transporter (DMT)-like permease
MERLVSIRQPKLADFSLLFLLGGVLGSAFLFMKVGVRTIPPITLVAGRLTIAAIALCVCMKFTKSALPRSWYVWKYFLLLGVLANIVPFSLITWSEIYIDSSLASIFMSLIPLFTATMAQFLTDDEHLSIKKVLGLGLGFSGVFVLLAPSIFSEGLKAEMLPQFACLSAAFCYSFARIQTRKLHAVPALVTSTGVLICASVLSIPISIMVDQPWTLNPSFESLLAVLCLALLCTAFAYLIIYRLIAEIGATFMTTMNYLVPLFGILWGYIFLGEIPKFTSMLAAILVFVGLVIMNHSTDGSSIEKK